jgi:tripartite ATP-independent transporter DctM subunit
VSPEAQGVLGCLALLILLVGSMPVAFAMAVVGFAGIWSLSGFNAATFTLSSELFSNFGNGSLTVIPLFILMGQVAFHSGISGRLFEAAYRWLGALPGGLAMATVGACTGFGAICGSGPATAATMAAVALPEMRRRNYSMELASGAVAAGGSLGMMIPPSVVFIVYGIMTEQSPGDLFIAGILPGLLLALLFCITIYINCVRRPEQGPPAAPFTWRQRLAALAGVGETLALFTLVIGGMFGGLFTPVEAAAVGATGSIVLSVVRRQLSWRGFQKSLLETVRTSCMVMMIVAGAMIFGRFLTATNLPLQLASLLARLPLPNALVMAGIIGFYLVAGCFVDALALVLLTVPVFYEAVIKLGYDPIWFGVIIVVVTQMGVISPPVGVNAYVVSGIERDIPLQTVFKGALPFLGALVVGSVLLMLFPEICTYLPKRGPGGMYVLLLLGALALAQAGALYGACRWLRVADATYGRACVSVLAKMALVQGVFSHFAATGATFWVAAGTSSLVAGAVFTKAVFRTRWRTATLAWGAAALSWGLLAWLGALSGHDLTRLF